MFDSARVTDLKEQIAWLREQNETLRQERENERVRAEQAIATMLTMKVGAPATLVQPVVPSAHEREADKLLQAITTAPEFTESTI
jgi:hypothetical protein